MISVVLLRPQNPANIGFAARAMANFEFTRLIIVDPECKPDDKEAIYTSKHAKHILKKAKRLGSLDKVKENHDLTIGTTSITGTDFNIKRNTVELIDLKIDNRDIAIVFGNEGTGLTNSEIDQCDFMISIPTSTNYSAMNLSHAVAIVLYEIFKKSNKKKITDKKPASAKDLTFINKEFGKIIDRIDFINNHKRKTQKITWKAIFARSMLKKREFFVVMGFIRKLSRSLGRK